MLHRPVTSHSTNSSKRPEKEGLLVASLFGVTGLLTFFRKLSIHAATAAELPRL
jgi:hypothetical protein